MVSFLPWENLWTTRGRQDPPPSFGQTEWGGQDCVCLADIALVTTAPKGFATGWRSSSLTAPAVGRTSPTPPSVLSTRSQTGWCFSSGGAAAQRKAGPVTDETHTVIPAAHPAARASAHNPLVNVGFFVQWEQGP